MTKVLRVVGPPGAGKSLLITSLMETLRSRGYRTVAVARREDGTTVLTFSHGARVVLDDAAGLERLAAVATSIDPSARLLLAEGYADEEADEAAHHPAVEVRPAGATPYPGGGTRLAVVAAEEISRAFAADGPGGLAALADRIERDVLGETPAAPPGRRAAVRRFLRRLR